jgi:ferredoxin-type protein NapF
VTSGAAAALSRRALLGGRLADVPPLAVGDGCLTRRAILCRTCGDACPEGAIRFRPAIGRVAIPELDAARCTACGDCVGACPVGALTLDPGVGGRRADAA